MAMVCIRSVCRAKASCGRNPVTDEVLGEIVRVAADAYTTVRHADDSPLYTEAPPVYDQPIELKLIPYYTWANRGEGEMRVWIHEL